MSRRKPRTGGAGIFDFTPDGDVQPAEIRDNPRRRKCQACNAPIGEPCRSAGRVMRGYHPTR